MTWQVFGRFHFIGVRVRVRVRSYACHPLLRTIPSDGRNHARHDRFLGESLLTTPTLQTGDRNVNGITPGATAEQTPLPLIQHFLRAAKSISDKIATGGETHYTASDRRWRLQCIYHPSQLFLEAFSSKDFILAVPSSEALATPCVRTRVSDCFRE